MSYAENNSGYTCNLRGRAIMIFIRHNKLLLLFLLLSMIVCTRIFLNNFHGRSLMKQRLSDYRKKRDFKKTPEPKGVLKKHSEEKYLFVIQQHHATHMHYDFRLEIDGVLKSWAVPKGPSLNPHEKRLATLTEDHPLEYATFEGIIPEGYGAGTVIVWDTGRYDNVTQKNDNDISMQEAFENGHIKINLHGKKLKGLFALTRFKGKDWLLAKVDDEYADVHRDPVETEPQSVLSKKTIAQLDKKFKH